MAEAVGREDRTSELAGMGADERAAAELANIGLGNTRPSHAQLISRTRRPAPELAPSWPFALIAAAVLVVLDLLFRRLGAPRGRRSVSVSVQELTASTATRADMTRAA